MGKDGGWVKEKEKERGGGRDLKRGMEREKVRRMGKGKERGKERGR